MVKSASVAAILALALGFSPLLEARTLKDRLFRSYTEISADNPWAEVFKNYSTREIAEQFNSKLRKAFLNIDFNDFLAYKGIYTAPHYFKYLPENAARFVREENSRNEYDYAELLKIAVSMEMYIEDRSFKVKADNPTDISFLQMRAPIEVIRLSAARRDKARYLSKMYSFKEIGKLRNYAARLAESVIEKDELILKEQKQRVKEIIKIANRIPFTLAEYVLASSTLDESIKRKEELAKLTIALIKDLNFEGARYVDMALNLISVSRLGWGKESFWERHSLPVLNYSKKSIQEKYEELALVISQERSYNAFKKRINELMMADNYNFIPMSGLILSYLEFIDRNDDYVEQDGKKVVNLEKQEMLMKLDMQFRNIQRALKEESNYAASLVIFNDAFDYYFQSIENEDEHLYRLSTQLKASGIETEN